ncbi:YybH family protein [Pseudonocardia sp. TRM90224]|uniref:YybH family protein n=1 Tax=Pseudonocardia sp. TRM90224 TaxID=2812678 RepID=UPI001E2B012D|nr:SgcJ/EcaC family oxidoreductase [Pseudonocardia sp. TRM90224]
MAFNEPTDVHDAFLTAVTSRDLDAVTALYTGDGLALDLTGRPCRGHAEIRAMFDGFVSSMRTMTGATRRIHVVGDLALSSANWSGTFVAGDGTVQHGSGVTAEVLRRGVDGRWRMVIDDPSFL